MIDRLDLVDAARQFGTAKHRFDSSGELTVAGPALEEGAGNGIHSNILRLSPRREGTIDDWREWRPFT
ncbi:hypothetical protein GNZ12_04605 [Paraburkholderia sp. 1N]|uniref:Uncharacterized protein n=1 Tax=Paraburkholderia solitsugae TaxID=2675748 RepID=A0ABX2BKZ1_9BURK|nr:hypothetical protein [Paraburkholderia solitsugae]NPT40601.1 hypothetical protein [Paraburkholderia solitsugae]